MNKYNAECVLCYINNQSNNILTLSCIHVDTPPPTDLSLDQIAHKKINISWKAPLSKYLLSFRIYLNDDDIDGKGLEVKGTNFIFPSNDELDYLVRTTVSVRATSHHYWSNVLGPKSIIIRSKKIIDLYYNFYMYKIE